jgi:hypothetical protein
MVADAICISNRLEPGSGMSAFGQPFRGLEVRFLAGWSLSRTVLSAIGASRPEGGIRDRPLSGGALHRLADMIVTSIVYF